MLYDQGFTISGARNRMQELLAAEREKKRGVDLAFDSAEDDAGLDILETSLAAPANGHGATPWGPADAGMAGASAMTEVADMAARASLAMPVHLANAGDALKNGRAEAGSVLHLQQVRRELTAIRDLLSGDW